MSMTSIGNDPWPIRVVEEGWHRLRDSAKQAITYFQPDASETPAADTQRWGLLATDIADTASTVELRMEIPGIQPEDLAIQLAGRTLRVSGTRAQLSKRAEGDYVISERAFGSFRRTFRLPEDVDADSAQADYRDGVLTLSLPKRTPKQSHRIAVQR